jgi:hypothetical protein
MKVLFEQLERLEGREAASLIETGNTILTPYHLNNLSLGRPVDTVRIAILLTNPTMINELIDDRILATQWLTHLRIATANFTNKTQPGLVNRKIATAILESSLL